MYSNVQLLKMNNTKKIYEENNNVSQKKKRLEENEKISFLTGYIV
jgi:hypothetical protein